MTEAPEERRLLAIMFTDVVGYTALTERRDEASAVRLRERHRELVQALVKQFDGEVVDTECLHLLPCSAVYLVRKRNYSETPFESWA